MVATIPGNELFDRVREELELYLSPSRASQVLSIALKRTGTTPKEASFGHMVQLMDLYLRPALDEVCAADEADELHRRACKVLDELASRFFKAG